MAFGLITSCKLVESYRIAACSEMFTKVYSVKSVSILMNALAIEKYKQKMQYHMI